MREFQAKEVERYRGHKRDREEERQEADGGKRKIENDGLVGGGEGFHDPSGRSIYGGGQPSGEVPAQQERDDGQASGVQGEDPVQESDAVGEGSGVKRKNEERQGSEDQGKRGRNKEGPQGVKRKVDDEQREDEAIRRLIEEEVERVNRPGWIRGEPNKMRHIGKVEVNQVINLVDRWVQEVKEQGFEEVSFKGGWEAWDDVKGGSCLINWSRKPGRRRLSI